MSNSKKSEDEVKSLESVHGDHKIREAREKSYFTKYKASISVRQKYIAQERILGTGASGSVLLFKTKREP